MVLSTIILIPDIHSTLAIYLDAWQFQTKNVNVGFMVFVLVLVSNWFLYYSILIYEWMNERKKVFVWVNSCIDECSVVLQANCIVVFWVDVVLRITMTDNGNG